MLIPPLNSINVIKLCPKQTNEIQKGQPQVTLTVNENGAPLNNGIKSPLKLLSPKYQSQSSLGEQNRSSTSPKHVHFINIITIISKEDEPRETWVVKPNTKDNDHNIIVKVEEEGEESEEEEEEEEKDNPEYTSPPLPSNPSISFNIQKVEGRLVEFKNQEIKYCEKIRVLEFKVESRANCIESLTKELEELKKEKKGLDTKLTGLPEFTDDTITDYTRPSPSVESNPNGLQNNSSFVSKIGESTGSILSKPAVKFVKAVDCTKVKTNKVEAARKSSVRYAEMYRRTSKSPNVKKGRACPKNNYTHKSMPPRAVVHKTVRPPMRTTRPNMNVAQPKRTSVYKPAHSYLCRPVQRKSGVRTQSQVLRVFTVCCCCSRQVNTAKPKAVINRRKWVNDIKASACWVWKPVKPNSASIILKKYNYVDVRGRSRENGYCNHDVQGLLVLEAITFSKVVDPIQKNIMEFTDEFGKEHTKSVYFKNEEDKRREVEYVMNKILGFYKECLELGPEYLIDWKKVTFDEEKPEVLGVSCGRFLDDDLARLSFISSQLLKKIRRVLCQLRSCKTCCVYNDRITDQEGAENNVVEKNKVKESMEANLEKLLKYNRIEYKCLTEEIEAIIISFLPSLLLTSKKSIEFRKHNSSKLEQELFRSKLMASSSNSPCAACKFLRRKCQPECVFAPYFPPDQPQKFANVHKVFGASNVTKLLNELHPHQREDAVNSLAYEADMRLRDPVYGCVGVISLLQHQLRQLQMDLTYAKSELSKFQNHNLSGTTAQGLIAAAAAAAAATHHQTLGNNLISCCSGGVTRDNLYQQHQQFFSPRDQQTSIIRAFDINNNYDTTAGVLAMNISSGGIGQHPQFQQPRGAGTDDRPTTIDPS
nr:LOB domain-containing protein 6 [Tanacetum cinerariifolium]